jgi:hypothetical protein
MDRFPEAFERFENDVDISRFESYHQLTLSFRWWAGERWKGTVRQWEALNAEAENLGFTVPEIYRDELRDSRLSGYYVSQENPKATSWRREVVTVNGNSQNRYRDLKTGRFIKKP